MTIDYVDYYSYPPMFQPSEKGLAGFLEHIRGLRGSAFLPASMSGVEDEIAVAWLADAASQLLHLREKTGKGGPETRKSAKLHLKKLSRAVTDLDAALQAVTELIGDQMYGELPEVARRHLIEASHHPVSGERTTKLSDDGQWEIADPLWWTSSGFDTLNRTREWVDSNREVIARAEAALRHPGRQVGSPDRDFCLRAFDVWLLLARRDVGVPERPKTVEITYWLETCYAFAGVAAEGDLNNYARQCNDQLKAKLRQGMGHPARPEKIPG